MNGKGRRVHTCPATVRSPDCVQQGGIRRGHALGTARVHVESPTSNRTTATATGRHRGTATPAPPGQVAQRGCDQPRTPAGHGQGAAGQVARWPQSSPHPAQWGCPGVEVPGPSTARGPRQLAAEIRGEISAGHTRNPTRSLPAAELTSATRKAVESKIKLLPCGTEPTYHMARRTHGELCYTNKAAGRESPKQPRAQGPAAPSPCQGVGVPPWAPLCPAPPGAGGSAPAPRVAAPLRLGTDLLRGTPLAGRRRLGASHKEFLPALLSPRCLQTPGLFTPGTSAGGRAWVQRNSSWRWEPPGNSAALGGSRATRPTPTYSRGAAAPIPLEVQRCPQGPHPAEPPPQQRPPGGRSNPTG